MRTDIQGLRAIAVAIVLIYHLTPDSLTGGYIGVDVFFVISGFLITGQILRELTSRGTIDLPRFWARRARRLLPAALVVLGLTLLAVRLLAPAGFAPSFLTQIAASAAYVQNWVLAGEAVDYMANDSQVSPVQHYWSLSVEEQFYIVWPVVAVLAAAIAMWIAKRRPRDAHSSARRAPSARTVLILLIGLVTVASFTASIVVTAQDPARAYFVTTTRAWEFAIGGLLAALATARTDPLSRLSPAVRSILTWAGLAGILAAALLYTEGTPFPGYTGLLPVLATALVIVGGEPELRWSPRALLAARPMQWLGDVSYGIYLWHFPLIILAPFALGHTIRPIDALLITAATLLLAWGSKVLVEDPFRTGQARSWTNARTLAITTAGMVALLIVSLVGLGTANQRLDSARAEVSADLESPARCVGSGALDDVEECEPLAEEEPIPDPSLADQPPEDCLSPIAGNEIRVCEYGVGPEEAERTIALIGDSHAEQWLITLDRVAQRQKWRLVVMAKASCPFTAGERDFITMTDLANQELRQGCSEWNEAVLSALEQDPDIDTVVTSAKSSNRVVSDGEDWRPAASTGYLERWETLPDSVERVIAIRDTPQLRDDVLDCVEEHGATAARECASTLEDAIHQDPLAEAAVAARGEHPRPTPDPGRDVSLIDLSAYFIVDDQAPPVIGGVLAYRDSHHVSWAYAEMLVDPLEKQLTAVMPSQTP
ncbi:acyltransferase family protein [Leucobacter sp. GX24907]